MIYLFIVKHTIEQKQKIKVKVVWSLGHVEHEKVKVRTWYSAA